MTSASRVLLSLIVLGTAVFVCGCGGDSRTKISSGTSNEEPASAQPSANISPLTTAKTNTKPDALNRANLARLDFDFPESELVGLFGPPQQSSPEGDTRQYIWTSGKAKLDVRTKNGKVVSAFNPILEEVRKKQLDAYNAAGAIYGPLREYVLKHNNHFPAKLEDLDLGMLKGDAKTMAILNSGEVVVPWGKSANCLVWAWWKDTPEIGGPYFRYDHKGFPKTPPKEFARLNAIVLTAETIPADLLANKPGPKDPQTAAQNEKKGIGAQGFFTAGMIQPFLVTSPTNLDEIAKHQARDYWSTYALRLLEKGAIVVRWGRDPKQGVYAYPRGFPKAGDPDGWAIYKGQWVPFERIEDAKKAFDE